VEEARGAEVTPVAGIFVGGQATRMGGIAKGLLPAPDSGEPLVVRLSRLCMERGLEVVLVGSALSYARALPQLRMLPDGDGIDGPLGGLAALLSFSQERPAIALACDLPFVTSALLERLSTQASNADVLSMRLGPDAPWEPLLARYASARVLPVLQSAAHQGIRSFQKLFALLQVEALALGDAERPQLRDWDSPGDLPR
jgi:molybdopterin-guanine dinucleotide biosynthesis protein A